MKQWRFKAKPFGDEWPDVIYLGENVPFLGDENAAELELCRRIDEFEGINPSNFVLEGYKVVVLRGFRGKELRV